MYRFDCVLIDPTPDALSRTLGDAAAAANKGCQARLLRWPADDFADFVTTWRAAPEGQRQWTGPGAIHKSRDKRSAAAIVWWSDPLGRKHCRVVGDRIDCGSSDIDCGSSEENDLLDLEFDPPKRPMLWRVYPDDLYLRQNGKAWPLWAVCRCGACGPPEKLGWMGPWCAACHDRAEEGTLLSRPDVYPPVVLSGHLYGVENMAFGLDGRILLTPSEATVRVWDIATGEVRIRKFPGTGSTSLAVSADGRTAAVCVGTTIHLWSLLDDTADLMLPLPPDDTYIDPVTLAFSPDGASLAWASNCWLTLHDLATGRPRWSIPNEGGHHLSFSPDSQTIVLISYNGALGLWATADGEELSGPYADIDSVVTAVYSPDGKTLATAVPWWREDSLCLWDVASGTVKTAFDGPVDGLAFSPDSKLLAAISRDGRLRLLDPGGWLLGTFRWHQHDLTAVAFSPDGRWIATGALEDRVKLWPVEGLLGPRAARPSRPKRKRT